MEKHRLSRHAGMNTGFMVFFILVLLCVTPVAAEGFIITISDQSVAAGSKAVIPVSVTNAEELGEMNLEISYDPATITFSDIELGSISKNGIIETTETTPGIIQLNLIDESGISQDGPLFILTFDVPATASGSSSIRIIPKGIYNLDNKEIPVSEATGTLTINEVTTETPLSAGITLLAVALIGLVGIFLRRRG